MLNEGYREHFRNVQSLDEAKYLFSVPTVNSKDIYKVAPSYSFSPSTSLHKEEKSQTEKH